MLGAGSTMTCSNGTWNSTTVVTITYPVDLKYDTLWVPAFTSGPSILLGASGNLTMHVRMVVDQVTGNGSVVQGDVVTTGLLDGASGSIMHLTFDHLEQGIWSIQFARYGSAGNSSITVEMSSNATEYTCRTYTAPLPGNAFGDNSAFFNFTVTDTNPKCGFNKGSRDWALDTYIAIASLGGAIIIFTIFTCAITPWRKVIWYPPM